MRNSLSAYESYAKKQQYYFTEGNTENDNDPILFGDDGTNCTHYTMHDIFSCTHSRKIVTGHSHTHLRMRTQKGTKMRYDGHP